MRFADLVFFFIVFALAMLFLWLANVVIPRSRARYPSLANVGLGLCLVVAELTLGLLLGGTAGQLLAARGVTLSLAAVLVVGTGLLLWGLRRRP
jgi:hypothetical protein